MKPSGGPSQQLAWPRPLAGETHPHHCPLAEAQTALFHSVPYHCDSVYPHLPSPMLQPLTQEWFYPFQKLSLYTPSLWARFPLENPQSLSPLQSIKVRPALMDQPLERRWCIREVTVLRGEVENFILVQNSLVPFFSPSEYLEVGFCVFKRKPALVKLKDHVEEFIPISSPPSVFLQQTQLKENYLDWYNSIKL